VTAATKAAPTPATATAIKDDPSQPILTAPPDMKVVRMLRQTLRREPTAQDLVAYADFQQARQEEAQQEFMQVEQANLRDTSGTHADRMLQMASAARNGSTPSNRGNGYQTQAKRPYSGATYTAAAANGNGYAPKSSYGQAATASSSVAPAPKKAVHFEEPSGNGYPAQAPTYPTAAAPAPQPQAVAAAGWPAPPVVPPVYPYPYYGYPAAAPAPMYVAPAYPAAAVPPAYPPKPYYPNGYRSGYQGQGPYGGGNGQGYNRAGQYPPGQKFWPDSGRPYYPKDTSGGGTSSYGTNGYRNSGGGGNNYYNKPGGQTGSSSSYYGDKGNRYGGSNGYANGYNRSSGSSSYSGGGGGGYTRYGQGERLERLTPKEMEMVQAMSKFKYVESDGSSAGPGGYDGDSD
jgi:hypothetical protein